MFTITPSQVPTELLECVSVGLTPMITSSPGIGKSSLVAQFCRDHKLKMIDIRLSSYTPEDLNGFPMRDGDKAKFTPFDTFPLKGEKVPEGYAGWCLFLDEMTSASKPVQAAAYKLILDRMVGSYKLHPQVAIVAAGNKMSDRAVVNQMSTALQSRMIHYELEVSTKDFTEHAHKIGMDHRVIGFINFMPSKLMDFRPDHQDKTFACPRTWEFLSRLVKGKDISERISPRVAGTIGQGVAVEFITFAQEYDRLPKIRDIETNPESVQVPPEASTKYATMSMLIEHATHQSLDKILSYVRRFDIELQIIFCRGVAARNPKLPAQHEGFKDYTRSMVRYLS